MIMSDREHAARSATADFHSDTTDPPKPEPAVDPLAGLSESLGQLREFAAFFVTAKLDQFKLGIRQAIVYAALGIAGGIVGVAMLIAAAVMLLQGLAAGLAELLGGRLWAGNLIVSSVVLVAAAVGIYTVLGRFTIASRQRTIEKYERLRQAERANYGVDVAQRAHSTGPR